MTAAQRRRFVEAAQRTIALATGKPDGTVDPENPSDLRDLAWRIAKTAVVMLVEAAGAYDRWPVEPGHPPDRWRYWGKVTREQAHLLAKDLGAEFPVVATAGPVGADDADGK